MRPEYISIPQYLLRSESSEVRSGQLLQRLLKRNINKSNKLLHASYKGIKNYTDFRKYWFCKDCLTVFHLKASGTYKTTREYKLSCSNCNSSNISHTEELTKAIIDNNPIEQILSIIEKEIDIEINISDKDKYIPVYKETS